jgi:hypothetical protein
MMFSCDAQVLPLLSLDHRAATQTWAALFWKEPREEEASYGEQLCLKHLFMWQLTPQWAGVG